MIIDSQLLFSSAQAMPNGTTSQSTNVIDLGVAGHFFDTMHNPALVMHWSGTPVGTSVRIDLRSGATAADLTSSPVIHWSTGIIPQASYAARGIGSGLSPTIIPIPNGWWSPGIQSTGGTYLQYLGLIFITVGDASAGLLTAYIAPEGAVDIRHYAASGYTAPTI